MQAKQTRTLLGLLLVTGAMGAAGCQTKNLHPAHGLRFKEMQAAQYNARGAHEPQVRGEEGARAVGAYYEKLAGGSTPGGGDAAPPPSNSTAGVKPLVR